MIRDWEPNGWGYHEKWDTTSTESIELGESLASLALAPELSTDNELAQPVEQIAPDLQTLPVPSGNST